MVIQWYGQACFKIQSGELVLALDPYTKEYGLTPPRFRADITLITHSHPDHSNAETIAGEPFLITGPGEYEVKGVSIRGLGTYHDASQGSERGPNTIYQIHYEGMTLLHLGDFGEPALREATLEELEDVDILMLPVGGTYTIDAAGATRVVKQLEPRIVIPMHYKIPGLTLALAGLDPFLKEMGMGRVEAQDRLTIRKKEMGERETTEVVVLKPASSTNT